MDGFREATPGQEVGDDIKVSLQAAENMVEKPWCIVEKANLDGTLTVRVNNDCVCSFDHGYDFGDLITVDQDERLVWKPVDNLTKN